MKHSEASACSTVIALVITACQEYLSTVCINCRLSLPYLLHKLYIMHLLHRLYIVDVFVHAFYFQTSICGRFMLSCRLYQEISCVTCLRSRRNSYNIVVCGTSFETPFNSQTAHNTVIEVSRRENASKMVSSFSAAQHQLRFL